MLLTKDSVSKTVRGYIIISIGILVYAFGYAAVVIPADIMTGGMGGVGLLVYYATGGANGGIPVAYTIFAGNAILLGVAFYFIGGRFGAKTIYAIFFTSFALALMQKYVPPGLLGLAGDKLLSSILAGAICGAGISVVLSQGGSSGGTDIIAMIVNKYRNVSYGRVIMLCDLFILGSAVFIFKNISAAIYGYVMVAGFGYTVDAIIAGNKQSSQIFIISKRYELIAQRVSDEVRRGVTLVDAEGWYTKERKKMVMVVCRKNETQTLFRVIKECDPDAFITVGSVMGVYGLGFETLKR
ncbi:MAG: YitT family protein [Rikenellaceae bacterium]|jgi:uncharacterized membrane-anchored protein YitT (DUF2179 family)|nr:YitT family protein [Rikenellaceae bacterium]